MNRFLNIFLVLLLCFGLCACDKKQKNKGGEESLRPEEIYEFLNTEYIVTSRRVSFDITYECNYYFIDGFVAGEKQTTIFPDENSAKGFYDLKLDDYPDAILDGSTVIIYTDDKDETFFGSDLEKLIFSLELANYQLEYSFDKDEFLLLFNDDED